MLAASIGHARAPPLPAALVGRRTGREARPGLPSSSATPTARRSPTSISRTSPVGARRPSCLPATRRGASPPTSRSCRTCCGADLQRSGRPRKNAPAGYCGRAAGIRAARWAREDRQSEALSRSTRLMKGRPKPPPQFQLTVWSPPSEPTIGPRGPLYLADPSMSAAGRCGHFNWATSVANDPSRTWRNAVMTPFPGS